jgi:hypothetical protein
VPCTLCRTDSAMFFRYANRAGGVEVGHFDPANQVFSHMDIDGVGRHFHIPTLKLLIEQNPKTSEILTTHIDLPLMNFVVKNRGVDLAYTRAMTPARAREPGIGCIINDELLLVDGNHRLVKRVLQGYRTMQAWIVFPDLWEQSLLIIPQEINTSLAVR